MPVTAGTRLGPYEVVASLGAGGMGEVYRARDTRLGRHVAIKILAGAVASDATFRERFQREARTVSSLSHPAICALFDVGEQDGESYLVMECLEGETLGARLARGPLAIDEALHLAIQIADGLAHAHAAGVVHRDLKPRNVMLLDGGLLKILDFGLARRFASDAADVTIGAVSESGVMVGTIAYMSPEQTMGTRVDHRSDIFSFGVVLYEMLAGVRPFDGNNAFSVMKKIVEYQAPSPALVRPSVPQPVAELLAHMLEKSAGERPQSMRDIAARLRAIAGVPSISTSAPVLMPSPAARRRVPRAALAAAIAAAVVAAVLMIPAGRQGVSALFARPAPAGGSIERPSSDPAVLARTAAEWTTQGRAYLRRYDRQGHVDRALEAFQRAVALDASHAAAHAGLAEAFLRKDASTPDAQWVRQATESARRAVTLNPDLAAGHAALGLVLLRAKQPDEGRKEIDRALDLDPLNLTARLGAGEYHMSKGERAEAEAIYQRAARAAPDEWLPSQMLGRSLYAQAKYSEAASAWEEAARKSPDNVLVLRNLGAVYHMLERTDEAASALQRALEIEPAATVYSNLGTLRFFQGRYSDAAAAFEKAVERNATYYLYWANLGDAYRWVPGNEEKARQAYTRAIALLEERLRATRGDPTADLQTQLALYLAKQGDRGRAARELKQWQAAAAGVKTPASYFRALVVLEILGEREAALASLDAALQAGYPRKEIQGEPELTRLRSDPRYHRIVAAFESATATPTGAKAR